MMSILALLIILLLTLGLAFFSAAEIAFFSLPAARIKSFASSLELRKRLIATLLSRPQNLLVTIFMMSTLVNVLIQNFTSNCFDESGSWALKVGIPFLLTLIFGDLIPKYLGLQHNQSIAEKASPVIEYLQNRLGNIQEWITDITSFVSRTLFFFLKREKLFSDEELRHVLNASEQTGILDPEEVNLVKGYFNLQDKAIWELMTPRDQIATFDCQKDSLSRLLYLFTEKEHSHVLICEKGIDHIVGVLSIKNYLIGRTLIETPQHLMQSSLITKPFFAPESTTPKQLLQLFEQRGLDIAIVIDEYEVIKGVIFEQDIQKALIGHPDETSDQKDLYIQPNANIVIADATLELNEIKQLFGIELKSNHRMLTIGGWLEEQLGIIPQAGTTFEWQGLLFQVLSAEPNRIRRVHIKKLGPAASLTPLKKGRPK